MGISKNILLTFAARSKPYGLDKHLIFPTSEIETVAQLKGEDTNRYNYSIIPFYYCVIY